MCFRIADRISVEEDRKTLDRLVSLPVCLGSSSWSWYLTHSEVFPTFLDTVSPLHIAAYVGNIAIAESLLRFGACLDIVDAGNRTPLHFAAGEGHPDMIRLLCAKGATLNALDINLYSPSMYAVEGDKKNALGALMHCGADLSMASVWRENTYHRAGRYNFIPELVSCSSITCEWGPKSENLIGTSILTEAMRGGDRYQITYVLNLALHESDYKPRKSNVITAAVQNDKCFPMKHLLRRLPQHLISPLLAHQAVEGGTPLYAACTLASPRWEEAAILMLLNVGADLELEGGDHGTPLMEACAAGSFVAVKLLVSKGAKICYMKEGRRVSALDAARHFSRIVRWLLVGRFTEGPKVLTFV